jgi:DNA-binding NarL/FixJ family response regulator
MRVYIADNHKLVVEGMKAVLMKSNIDVVGSFSNGLEVIKWRETNDTDVLILDISMPILNGIDVLKYFQDRKINQPTLIVSAYNDYYFIIEAMKYGACGYILKTEGDKLVHAVKTVHKGEKYVSKKVIETLLHKNHNPKNESEKTETKFLLKDLVDGVIQKSIR